MSGRRCSLALALGLAILAATQGKTSAVRSSGAVEDSLSGLGLRTTDSSRSWAGPAAPIFRNGVWSHDDPFGPRNAYIAALLAKDVYWDLENGSVQFCDVMAQLGSDTCEVVQGPQDLVYALVTAGPSVILVFRGSNTPQNWIADLISLRTTNVDDFGCGSSGVNVAAGFYQLFASSKRSIVALVQKAMKQAAAADPHGGYDNDGGGGKRLWIVGHSLGGAIAVMAAAHLDGVQGIPATGVYTFGCPKVGDRTWANVYQQSAVTLRYENAGDLVPTLPFGTSWHAVGQPRPVSACGPIALAQLLSSSRGGGSGSELSSELDGPVPLAATDGSSSLRRMLRGQEHGAAAADAESAADAATAEYGSTADLKENEDPAPGQVEIGIRDHLVGTYVRVVYSCLSGQDQHAVPGPGGDDDGDNDSAAAIVGA